MKNGFDTPEAMLRHIQARPREEQYHLHEQVNAIMERHEEQLLDLRTELIEYMEKEKLWHKRLSTKASRTERSVVTEVKTRGTDDLQTKMQDTSPPQRSVHSQRYATTK